MFKSTYVFLCALLLLPGIAWAAPLSPAQVPEPLKPWVGWVLDGQNDQHCPYAYNAANKTCAWPGALDLKLTHEGGSFSQKWRIFGESSVRLPGDAQRWPLQVRSNTQSVVVLEENGYPVVKLPAGEHVISGYFAWDELPETLFIAPSTGLVQLSVNGSSVSAPDFNALGSLWLNRSGDVASEDNLDVQVFRQIRDGHPLEVITHIQLRVSGKQRTIELAPVLLEGLIPLHLNSALPARMGQNGVLQIQLRPGEWVVEVTGRAVNSVTALSLPSSVAPWPSEEVWVFSAEPNVRQVQVEGVRSTDSNQTRLPPAWASFPAFLLGKGDVMTLTEQHRGVLSNVSKMALEREIWLDFDGKGYTFKDKLSGFLAQPSRLDVLPVIQLGRVSVNGEPQLITQHARSLGNESVDENAAEGVEIRAKNVLIEAESRYVLKRDSLPVSGWKHELQSVNTTLHLPPGWLLVSTSGSDNLANTWLSHWHLLDLFLVLLIIVASVHLFGWGWGALAAVTLLLTWHHADAPRYIWLNLLAVVALLRVVPKGAIQRWLNRYRWLSLLVLLMIALPYAKDTVRNAIYPQLQFHATLEAYDAPSRVESYLASAPKNVETARVIKDLKNVDPNSAIQTGPGLPAWGWPHATFSWTGVVKPDEHMSLWLISPKVHSSLKVFGVILLFLLMARFAFLSVNWLAWLKRVAKSRGSLQTHAWLGLWLSTALTMLSIMGAQPVQASDWFYVDSAAAAVFPAPDVLPLPNAPSPALKPQMSFDPSLLHTLQERLLRAPECLPGCAQIEQMDMNLADDHLSIRLRIHAGAHVAVPLPSSQVTWVPQQVWVNNVVTDALRRDDEQQLWVVLDVGQHDVLLRGILPKRTSTAISLPLKPRRVTWQGKGWHVEGVGNNGVPENQLQISRTVALTDTLSQENPNLPIFVKVSRKLSLGLDWNVMTTVSRVSESAMPISLSIPLLDDEQPLSDQFAIKDRMMQVNLKPHQNTIEWTSSLPKAARLKLVASSNSAWLEEWSLVSSPMWHVEAAGLPINAYDEVGEQGMARWLPWPSEALDLTISRPQGVPGQTVTLLASQVEVNVGKRARDVTLLLSLNSSRGSQHSVMLPEGADLKELSINGVKQSILQQQGRLVIPLMPGKQEAIIAWQEEGSLPLHYRFPRVDLGLPSVNNASELRLPQDRWVLWVQGPLLGPAVLFWSFLALLLVFSILLGRSGLTPLKSWQWFLLGVGVSQSATFWMIVIAAWLIALAARGRYAAQINQRSPGQFNLIQFGLVSLTVLAIGVLMYAVAAGLLGTPNMQVAGNQSTATNLLWYQDRVGGIAPQPSVISVDMFYYRLLMLLWAWWLALALLDWLRWGWRALNQGELWKHQPASAKRSKSSNQNEGGNQPKPSETSAFKQNTGSNP